ncbi:MAG: 30S ribosomal protein S11 [Candidatus Wolfebacteria bacterium]|nr:30S ribosomal protein S11 [Candidatus Wolfebacteria bacterium]
MAKVSSQEKTSSKKIDGGRIYINASYNNTILSVTDRKGGVIAWASAGSMGFSGPKKATPFAASKIVAAVAEKLKKTGIVNVDVIVRGVGSGRDSAVRSLAGQGFNILSIRDVTPIPHNGPKARKTRRV